MFPPHGVKKKKQVPDLAFALLAVGDGGGGRTALLRLPALRKALARPAALAGDWLLRGLADPSRQDAAVALLEAVGSELPAGDDEVWLSAGHSGPF